MTYLLLILTGYFAGFIGSLLGLGGGIIVVPSLTLIGVDIKSAVAISILTTIATWASASEKYLKTQLVDFKIAFLLGSATSLGAFLGSRFLYLFSEKIIVFVFVIIAFVVILSNLMNIRRDNEKYEYSLSRLFVSFLFMNIAGFISAVLGIGAGVFKVFTMDRIIRLPYRTSTATSMFLIGITASSSAVYYAYKGDFEPRYASLVAIGAILGGITGSRVMLRLPVNILRIIFSVIVVLLVISLIMKVYL